MSNGFAFSIPFILSPVGKQKRLEHVDPFAPFPIQEIQCYYGSIRPCAPHRYSPSRRVLRLRFSLRIGTTGSHVSYNSPVSVHAALMPEAVHPVNRSLMDSFTTHLLIAAFDLIELTFDTSSDSSLSFVS
jgi:hypothetical protein